MAQDLLRAAANAREQGRLAEAVTLLRQALRAGAETMPEAHLQLGTLLGRLGDAVGAAGSLLCALELHPDYPEALLALGELAQQLGDHRQAAQLLERAAALEPRAPATWARLAAAQLSLGEPAAAAHTRSLERAAAAVEAAQPSFADLLLLGREAIRLQNNQAAYGFLLQANALSPKDSSVSRLLGALEEQRGRYAEAQKHFRSAIEHGPALPHPDAVRAWRGLGTVLAALGDPEGIPMLRRVLAASPDCPDTHLSLGSSLLLHGRYREGWEHYEWRTRTASYRRFHTSSARAPAWDGSPLRGRTLLVCAEQGLGDTIQFARFVPLAAARGGDVLFEVQPELLRLLTGLGGPALHCFARGEEPPRAPALQAPLLSLPHLLGADLAHLPAPLLPRGLPIHPAPSSELQVGIVWAGNPSHVSDQLRSIAPELFAPLCATSGAQFWSLQHGPKSRQTPLPSARDLVGGVRDFLDTAEALRRLDLVIAVDTAVAHLAASLGKPVWLLLPQVPDWRWGASGSSTPWYPSVRLFRQGSTGGWAPVLEQVAQQLQRLVADRS